MERFYSRFLEWSRSILRLPSITKPLFFVEEYNITESLCFLFDWRDI